MGRRPVFLVPHTHWDREWYLPFEAFREQLVAMMDGLIELLDRDPRFAHFHLDGQTAMIDDYLEVRPDREADLRRLARAGRISIGPWFTQMDEFLVSGESLIRNLEWGLARARDLAGEGRMPMAGYLPDQFGHIGQMPQILRSLGIGHAVVWRGVPATIDRTTFKWESPDGSWVLAEYLPFGYSVGASLSACRDAEELTTALGQAVSLLEPMCVRDRLLITVGSDHHVPPASLAPLLEQVRRDDAIDAAIGSISGFLDGSAPEANVPSWRGELRSAARAHLLPNVYSNRAHQKQQRARVETLLERVAEPLAALVPGFEWPEEELREAWRLLLWNGAHDSVCGCSVDEVARAVDERYERAESLAKGIVSQAISSLAARTAREGLIVFNPSPFERHGVPGLGWKVAPDIPVARPVEISVENGRFATGGFEFRLMDEWDIGDLYTFCPMNDRAALTPEAMKIGDRAFTDGEGRLHEYQLLQATWVGLEVSLQASGRPSEASVAIWGSISNSRPNHRLRLHVRLAAQAAASVALAPFEIVERPLVSEGGTETPSPTWPARGAVLAGGVAVFGDGVFEYEVIPDPPELAITLLRSVGTISQPQLATRGWAAGPDIATPEAQMMGESYFSLSFLRGVRPEELPSRWEDLQPLAASGKAPGGGDLPDTGSLLEVEGAELSSVRKVDGTVEVRIWNPSNEPREARVAGRAIRLGPARIETVRLD
jgi:alpha-mannosidase